MPDTPKYKLTTMHRLILAALGAGCTIAAGSSGAAPIMAGNKHLETGWKPSGMDLTPLVFEANVGQISGSNPFLARANGYWLHLRSDGVDFQPIAPALQAADQARAAILPGFGFRFVGASDISQVLGQNKTGGVSRYYDKKQTPASEPLITDHFRQVLSKNVYPGIDVVYYGSDRHLEYDFVVAPQADLGQIILQLWGADDAWVDQDGNLGFRSGDRTLSQKKPTAYQEIAPNIRTLVDAQYRISKNPDQTISVAFIIGDYDPLKPLIIDPLVISYSFSRLLGGIGFESASSVAVDAQGNTYIAGATTNSVGDRDAFVTKLNPSGEVAYTSYLGGSGDDYAFGVAIDGAGNAYVGGLTYSNTFNGIPSCGGSDGFVAKLGNYGAVEFVQRLGGSGSDTINGLALDNQGNIYATGTTTSRDLLSCNHSTRTLPVNSGALSTQLYGYQDAFIAKLGPNGGIQYEGYLGGSGADEGRAIFVDGSANAWIAGSSQVGRNLDAFAVQVGANASSVGPSLYLGGSGSDVATGIAVSDTKVFLAGNTSSTDFPVVHPFQGREANPRGQMGFVAQISKDRNVLQFSSLIGGSGSNAITGLAVDATGNAYVAGYANAVGLPLAGSSFRQPWQRSTDAFLAKVSNAGVLDFSSYLGGSGADYAMGIALGPNGSITLVGQTSSVDFPVTGTRQAVSVSEAFVTRFVETQAATLPSAPIIGAATAGNGSATVTFSPPNTDGWSPITRYTVTCVPANDGIIRSASGSASPILVSGLTSGKAYTCTVVATNGVGIGPASSASNVVTPLPLSAPGVPTLLRLVSSNGVMKVLFSAPASDGGLPIITYTATCSIGNQVFAATGSTSPIIVTGLSNGTSYQCSISARNSVGTSESSVAITKKVEPSSIVPILSILLDD